MIMRNSVILVDQIRQSARRPRRVDRHRRIRRAPLPPIWLTAAAAVLAMIPLSAACSRPMAIALMGGLIAATLLTLTFCRRCMAACQVAGVGGLWPPIRCAKSRRPDRLPTRGLAGFGAACVVEIFRRILQYPTISDVSG